MRPSPPQSTNPMNADDQVNAKVESGSTLATGLPREALDHRVMAHELVLACLVEHIAESEPRFLERLKYRFSRVAAADSEIVSAATYAHRMVDQIDAMLREASIPPGRRAAPPGPRVTGRAEDFAAPASETALLDVGEGTIKTMALPAGVSVELTASSSPGAAGGHRWVVDVSADTWDPEKRETKLHYTSAIGPDEPEQRIEIPKQDVDCILRISAAHRTNGGWEADEPHVAVNRQSWVAIGFGAPSLPAIQPDALVLAFRFKT